MAGVDIGGDESVMWKAYGDNVRKDKTLIQGPFGRFGWLHSAVDEADVRGDYSITIELPEKEKCSSFFASLRKAVDSAESLGTPLTFTLPIQYGHHNQIQVKWTSDLSDPHPNSPRLKAAFAKLGALVKGPKKASAKAKKAAPKSAKKASGKSKKKSSKGR
jgi:hypothetical protein